MARRLKSVFAVRTWQLWSSPRRAVTYLLSVDAAAVVATAVLGVHYPMSRSSLGYFGLIVIMGVLAAETTRRVERMRRWFSNAPHVNMSSVWTMSAALLTTPLLAALTVVILYAHLWARSWYRVSGVCAFRVVFNVSVVVLSCYAAWGVARAMPGDVTFVVDNVAGLAEIVLVIATYSVVNSVLAALALGLLGVERSPRDLLGTWQENSLEYATLCVGVLAAALLTWRPWLIALMPLPLYVLHRSVLIRQLEYAVTTDEKTGLLNAATWRGLAATEFRRAHLAGSTLGVLVADLDHFTQVNEHCGYRAGDGVLRAVAEAISHETRSGDLAGRLGGEEFGVLLLNAGTEDAVEIANRVCQRIRALSIPVPVVRGSDCHLRLTISIGAAGYPDAGETLEDVLLAADNALFAAKDAGRDRVRAVQRRNTGAHPRHDAR